VKQLAHLFEMSQAAISPTLADSHEAGLVTQRQSGHQRRYQLNPEPLKLVFEWVSIF
jgi:DNA-binding transcriptional ArsR family regulator